MQENSPEYWNNLYKNSSIEKCSWYESIPVASLKLIMKLGLAHSARIIDIGGGASMLSRHLLALGYTNITVLDFSSEAIEKGKYLLGDLAGNIEWIHADILKYETNTQYDLWHDRACFHFFINHREQNRYARKVNEYLSPSGSMILGAHSLAGTASTGDLPVERYSADTIEKVFERDFVNTYSFQRNHITPSNNLEPFMFCGFKRRISNPIIGRRQINVNA